MSEVAQSGSPEFSPEALAATATFLMDRSAFLSRIVEVATFNGDVVHRSVQFVTATGPSTHLLLVASPPRDELTDLLTIERSNATPGLILGREDTLLVTKLILELLCEVKQVDKTAPLVDLVTSVAVLSPEDSLPLVEIMERLREVPRTAPEAGAVRALANLYRTSENDLAPLHILAQSTEFMALFRFFRTRRPLFVLMQSHVKTCELRFALETGRQDYATSTGRELLRSLLGLSSYDLIFPIADALKAQSYHFRMRAPSNHYVSQCDIMFSEEFRTIAKPSDLVPLKAFRPDPPAFARFRKADPDGLVHVHVGNISRLIKPPMSLYVRVRVSERPLGQMGGALWRWTLVALFLFTLLRLGPGFVEAQSTMGVTLLLAIPAVLGIATLTTVQLGALNAPESARVASISSGVAALVGGLSLAWWNTAYAVCLKHPQRDHCSTAPPMGVQHTLQGLVIVTAAVLIFTFVSVLANVTRYQRVRGGRHDVYIN